MKKYFLVVLLLILSLVNLSFSGCQTNSIAKYYSNRENYVSATGTITHISTNVEKKTIYIGFEDLSYPFDDTTFKIVGKNYDIVINNGILNSLKVGIQARFISAPRYFGDGYVMPIVAIAISGNTYLDFEEGFGNFYSMYS